MIEKGSTMNCRWDLQLGSRLYLNGQTLSRKQNSSDTYSNFYVINGVYSHSSHLVYVDRADFKPPAHRSEAACTSICWSWELHRETEGSSSGWGEGQVGSFWDYQVHHEGEVGRCGGQEDLRSGAGGSAVGLSVHGWVELRELKLAQLGLGG